MKVKEKSEKVGLKLNIQKAKIMASGPKYSPISHSFNKNYSLRVCTKFAELGIMLYFWA